jgi:putative ABC transport system permease protein
MAVSLCLLGVLLALYRALFYGGETTPGQAMRIVVHHKVALTQELPIADEQKIRQVPGVHAVTSLRWFGGAYKDSGNPKNRFGQFAIEPASLTEVYPELKISEPEEAAFAAEKTACIASRALADRLGWKLGEWIPLVGATFLPVTLDLTLVGIFDNLDDTAVLYFNRDYLRDSLSAGDSHRDMVQQYYVETDNKDSVPAVAQRIDAMFDQSSYPTKSEPEQAFMLSFVSFLGNLKLFLAVIFGAVTLTILLISGNMLSMSVRERTREVGILKSLGFSSGEVLAMVMSEANVIALAGGVIGCGLATALCVAMAGAMKGMPGFTSVVTGLRPSPLIFMITLGMAFVIGSLSALIPGLNAARTSILEALRYNG